jgi:hypothetical protein
LIAIKILSSELVCSFSDLVALENEFVWRSTSMCGTARRKIITAVNGAPSLRVPLRTEARERFFRLYPSPT